ncbi:hypothetical protein LTR16_009566, partial [Cryomyces antarcticus]
DVTESMLMARFTMLLRCSYLCSTVGVAFTNCVPVPVDNMAKRTRCASFFSEWLGEMIKIHSSFGFKMTIMAMGAFAADSVRRTFSSYRGTTEMVNYIGVTNPAAISYMNVDKYPASAPIPNQISSMEMHINDMMTLHEYLNEKRIGALTRALLDHTADELSVFFINMARNLFTNESMGGMPGMTSSGIPNGGWLDQRAFIFWDK